MRGERAQSEGQTLYAVLGLNRLASQEEIAAAFRAAAKRCHPDVGGDPVEFMQVKAAYDVLSDESKRREYDASLRGNAQDSGPADWTMETDVIGADFGEWSSDSGAARGGHPGTSRAQRYGFPESSTFARPNWFAIGITAVAAVLLTAIVIQLFTEGIVGILIAVLIVGALGVRIFSLGDAFRARRILRIVVGVLASLGILIVITPGTKWPGVAVIALAGLTYLAIEHMRSYRIGLALRKNFLRFLDDVQYLSKVDVYYVEHAQPSGGLTRVSLLDFDTGAVAGPKSLWGVWAPGMIVAVDGNRRVVAATTSAGLEATLHLTTIGRWGR